MSMNNSTQNDQIEEALAQLEEHLKECKNNDDSKGRGLTLFEMAQIEISRDNKEKALLMLIEAYSLVKDLGDLSYICPIGELLGQLLYVSGSREEGLNMVREAFVGLKEMGSDDEAANTENLMDAMLAHSLANPLPAPDAE
ncbi:hypothetical protein SAMN05660337_1579 [Maridesulfovibrio ferrireducens]|uniref:Tetratricopeptide repeat-containing protein n=1 Tax=Maridesulfovibrio ferrireducens TaxID=246191 RepID=A0A1G9FK45_9BACT|nr:hypothetical protein [Maridesulfovibrio ferrireducens]SDK88725.1 hypothetical protein SAMN05660337_1579 [Maridesulfovibrio ferrireducens]